MNSHELIVFMYIPNKTVAVTANIIVDQGEFELQLASLRLFKVGGQKSLCNM